MLYHPHHLHCHTLQYYNIQFICIALSKVQREGIFLISLEKKQYTDMLLHHQPQIISCSLICSHQYHISSMDLFSPLFPWCYSVKCPHTPQHQSLYYSKSNNANDDAQFFILSILYVFCVVHNMFLYVYMHHLSQNNPLCIQTKLRETIFYRNTSVSLVSP